MKLTKTKLKQLIKEALEGDFGEEPGVESGEEGWNSEVDALLKNAEELYASLPEEGKRALTDNFEMYFDKWEEELEGGEEEGEKEFSFTGDVGKLSGDEGFGVGYEAGKRGL